METYLVKKIDGKLMLVNQKGWIDSNPDNYPVVGEISPEAKFVKEGDEFDEEDWEIWVHNIKLEKSRLSTISPITIKIKGSCGHFH